MNKKGDSTLWIFLIGLLVAIFAGLFLLKATPCFLGIGCSNEVKKQYFYDTVNAKEVPENRLAKLNSYNEIIERESDNNDISKNLVKSLILTSNANVDPNLKNDQRAGLLPLDLEMASKYNLIVNAETDERLNPEKDIIAGVAYLKYLKDKVHDDDTEQDDIPYIILAYYKGMDALLSACPVAISGGFENCDASVLVNVPFEDVIGYEKYINSLE